MNDEISGISASYDCSDVHSRFLPLPRMVAIHDVLLHFFGSSGGVKGTFKKKVGSPSQPLALTSGRHRATMEETGRNVRGMLPKLHISTVEVAEDKSERPRRSRSFVRVGLISVARITATVKSQFSAIERLSAIMCGINENRVTGK